MLDPDALLAKLHQLSDENVGNAMLDMYETVDHALTLGEIDQVDAFLDRADVEQIRLEVLLGMLTIVLPARGKLPSHRRFFNRVVDLIVKTSGNDAVHSNVQGLEPAEPLIRRVTVSEGTDLDTAIASFARSPWIGRATRAIEEGRVILVEVDPIRESFERIGSLPRIPDVI